MVMTIRDLLPFSIWSVGLIVSMVGILWKSKTATVVGLLLFVVAWLVFLNMHR